ncbi:threonine/homoserine exporter RhtA [Zestomonas thermotolerans]|uniref:threonine/homoserine exporter RhtA n=1 Tax=Zestomonas thermotolerans TaxID=157784 RepID=UPI0004843B70|nr:threonine/homoserine exporter RhtA [Pseudomonas thermotolerans]
MPRTPTTSLVLPITLLLVAMVSIQGGAALAKGLFPVIGAEGTTALRLGLASLIMLLVLRPWRARLSLRAWPALLAYGAVLGCMNLLYYMSLRTIPLGIAVSLEFTGPLGLALLASRRWLDFLWVGLAALGLWLLLPTAASKAPLDPLGMALALGAGLCWALYIVFGQKAGAEHGVQTVTLGMLIATLVVFPVGLVEAGTSMFTWGILPLALGVAVLSSALPYSLEMVAMTRMPTRTFSILMSIEPAIAALSGLVYLGERLTLEQWLAVGAIIIASAGAAATARGKAPQPAN